MPLADLIINGTPLPPAPPMSSTHAALLHGLGSYVLAAGQVWIYSPDPYSLDSHLLGPVRRDLRHHSPL